MKRLAHKPILSYTILIVATTWIITAYLKMPHVSWIPGFMLTWFTEKGLVFYKDFIQSHFPFSQLFLYPFEKLTNWNLETEPLLALAVGILSIFVLYFQGGKYLHKNGKIISIIFFSSLFWYFCTWIQFCEEMLIGLLIFMTFIMTLGLIEKKRSRRYIFGLGFLYSVTLLTGQVSAMTLATEILISIYILKSKSGKNTQVFSRSIISLILGLAIPIVITCLYFFLKHGLYDFYYWNIPYFLTYASLNKQKLTNLPLTDVLFFFMPVFLLLATFIKRVIKKQKENFFSNRLLIVCLIVGLSEIPFILFSVFHPHHFLYGLLINSFILGLVTDNDGKIIKVLSASFLTLYIFLNLFPWYKARFTNTNGVRNLSRLEAGDKQQDVINYLNKNYDSNYKITVVGDPMFYYRVGMLPANPYFSVIPWHFLPLSKTAPVFKKYPPDIWVIEKTYVNRLINGWKVPSMVEFINQELQKGYKQTYTNGEWETWPKKD